MKVVHLPSHSIPPLAQLMTGGGDARILLDPETGLNRYHSGPYPRDLIAFASSTANDLSADAMAYLAARFGEDAEKLGEGETYGAFLDGARQQIRDAYALDDSTLISSSQLRAPTSNMLPCWQPPDAVQRASATCCLARTRSARAVSIARRANISRTKRRWASPASPVNRSPDCRRSISAIFRCAIRPEPLSTARQFRWR